jgi:hypothetical protein
VYGAFSNVGKREAKRLEFEVFIFDTVEKSWVVET